MSMTDSAWIALSLVRHLGSERFRALVNHFGSAQAVLAADEAELRSVKGIGAGLSGAIRAADLREIEGRMRQWEKDGVQALTWNDSAYPSRLKPLRDAPPTLFARGARLRDGVLDAARTAAVVGTRKPSARGQDVAFRVGQLLSERGFVVISGLALGVDTAAHIAALQANGRAIGVLGSGVLSVYPMVNVRLATAILKRGALLCEISPDAGVSAAALVARNRLITGLADALIVIETEDDGGAMHAARFAKAQGRPIYALDCERSGNRALIADGAQPFSPTVEDLNL